MKKFEKMDKGALTASDMKSGKYKIVYFSMMAVLLCWCAIVILPILWIILSGFKDPAEIYAIPPKILPSKVEFSKLADAWSKMKFYKYYLNTFIMAGGCVLADIIVSGLGGYIFSRVKPKGYKILYSVCFAMLLLPGMGGTVPLYMLFKSMHLLNTFVPMWLMSMVNIFHIFLFKSFFDGISSSLVEAAQIDGASNLKIFFKIIIPLSVPVFITVAILSFNAQMSTFLWPYLTIQDNTKTVLGVYMYKLKTSNFSMDYQMLAILFSILPQIIIFAMFQKQIIGGVNVGGVKG